MSSACRFVSYIAAAIALALLTGCGITGGTSARKVMLNPSLGTATLNQPVRIGNVVARSDAGVNQAIGAYNWGKFDDADIATLRKTLELSLPSAPSSSTHTVHVVAQHFGLSYTNNRVTCLGIFDWCVTDGAKILASERFYAAYDSGDKFLGTETLGMAKNRVLHAAAERIAERSLAVANTLPRPPAPRLTFDDPETANATMPSHLKAVGSPGLVAAAVQQTMLGEMEADTHLLPEHIPPQTDWQALLTKLPPR